MFQTQVKKCNLFGLGQLSFKDGLPMEEIISENDSYGRS